MGRTQHACFTANNYTAAGLAAITALTTDAKVTRETRMTYLIFNQEAGENTGTPHLQGYVQMEKPVAIESVTKFLQTILGTLVRTFECNGSSEQNYNYCSKEATKIAGTDTVEIGQIIEIPGKKGQGKRSDLEEVKKAIESGMSSEDLQSNFFQQYAYCERFLTQYKINFDQRSIANELRDSTASAQLRSWQNDLLGIVNQPCSERKVRWFWESVGNVGKSWMARYLALHHNALILGAMKKADMLHAITKTITNKTCVVFDLTRTTEDGSVAVVYEVMEQLHNRVIFSGKYDSQVLYIPLCHTVVFANYAPDRTTMSVDRWDVHHIASV
ncbi:hypothetical protein ES705_33444 [subsurface metagenome]